MHHIKVILTNLSWKESHKLTNNQHAKKHCSSQHTSCHMPHQGEHPMWVEIWIRHHLVICQLSSGLPDAGIPGAGLITWHQWLVPLVLPAQLAVQLLKQALVQVDVDMCVCVLDWSVCCV